MALPNPFAALPAAAAAPHAAVTQPTPSLVAELQLLVVNGGVDWAGDRVAPANSASEASDIPGGNQRTFDAIHPSRSGSAE